MLHKYCVKESATGATGNFLQFHSDNMFSFLYTVLVARKALCDNLINKIEYVDIRFCPSCIVTDFSIRLIIINLLVRKYFFLSSLKCNTYDKLKQMTMTYQMAA